MLLPVVCNAVDQHALAGDIARQWQQPLLLNVDPAALTDAEFVFLIDDQGLALQQTGRKAPGPVRAGFIDGAVDHRRKFGGGKGQMIARAVGLRAGVLPQVLDATAGLGRDAFVLASLGCAVTLLERSPVIYRLLEDGLQRARQHAVVHDPGLHAIVTLMQLHPENALEYLGAARVPLADVIYLDPMFPTREKSADVKKEMKIFHDIVGKDEDADGLLEPALQAARYRVVVKRPRKAPFLAGRTPSFQLEGKSSRYDIYTLKKMPDRLPAIAAE